MIRPKNHLAGIYRSPPEEFDRTRFIRLDKNEDAAGIPEELFRAWIDTIRPDDLAAYPRIHPLYESLSTYLSVPEASILVTAGSDAAIKNVFEVFVSPGDRVIIPDPTYAMYAVYAGLFDADLLTIPYTRDLSFPMKKMIAAIDERTRLVALANPNSPTGTIVGSKEILALIRKAAGYDCVVLIDEAYYPFYPGTVLGLTGEYANLVVTRTFSKAFCLAAVRLGYAVAHPDIIRMLKICRPIYETNGPAAGLGCLVLKNQAAFEVRVREVTAGRDYLISEVRRMGFRVYESHTNFVNIEVGVPHVASLVAFFRERGILIKAGADHPALRSCIRITAGPVRIMEQVLSCLKEYADRCASP